MSLLADKLEFKIFKPKLGQGQVESYKLQIMEQGKEDFTL